MKQFIGACLVLISILAIVIDAIFGLLYFGIGGSVILALIGVIPLVLGLKILGRSTKFVLIIWVLITLYILMSSGSSVGIVTTVRPR